MKYTLVKQPIGLAIQITETQGQEQPLFQFWFSARQPTETSELIQNVRQRLLRARLQEAKHNRGNKTVAVKAFQVEQERLPRMLQIKKLLFTQREILHLFQGIATRISTVSRVDFVAACRPSDSCCG